MSKSLSGLLVAGLTAVTCLIVSVPAVAGEKAVHYERSSVVGDRNEIHAWNVPIVDKNGKVKYWDMSMSVEPSGDGSPPTYGEFIWQKSPKVSNKALQEGHYGDANESEYVCSVSNFALATGRTQTTFDCQYEDATWPLTFVVDDGEIDESHEFYEPLTNAGVDERADVANYFWGIGTSAGSNISIDNCGNYNRNSVVGIQQQGDDVVVYLFGSDSSLDCMSKLIRQ